MSVFTDAWVVVQANPKAATVVFVAGVLAGAILNAIF